MCIPSCVFLVSISLKTQTIVTTCQRGFVWISITFNKPEQTSPIQGLATDRHTPGSVLLVEISEFDVNYKYTTNSDHGSKKQPMSNPILGKFQLDSITSTEVGKLAEIASQFFASFFFFLFCQLFFWLIFGCKFFCQFFFFICQLFFWLIIFFCEVFASFLFFFDFANFFLANFCFFFPVFVTNFFLNFSCQISIPLVRGLN